MTAGGRLRRHPGRRTGWPDGRHPLELAGHRAALIPAITAMLTAGSPLVISFTVPGPPVPKERARVRVSQGSGGIHGYTPDRTGNAEAAVRGAFLDVSRRVISDRYSAWGIIALFAAPDRRTRDGDNMLKLVKDALQGAAWDTDSQVTEEADWHVIDRGRPRSEITVYVIPPGAPDTPAAAAGPREAPERGRMGNRPVSACDENRGQIAPGHAEGPRRGQPHNSMSLGNLAVDETRTSSRGTS